MKSTRKLSIMLSALFLFAALMVGSCLTVSAATAPKSVRIYPDSAYQAIDVTLDSPTDEIKNIKTSNKNLKTKVTGLNINVSSSSSSENENERSITLYTKKTGKYTVSFDIVAADGSKKETKKVTVYAYTDPAIKSATFAGKAISSSYPSKSSGKFKVTMNKGYKLKKIEVGKYVKTVSDDGKSIDTDMKFTQIKNNGKITLSKVPYEYGYENGSLDQASSSYRYYHKYWNTRIVAETQIRVTYIDKYTKQEATSYYYLDRLLI